MDEYQLQAATDAERFDAEEEAMAATVRRNVQRSANYVLGVVMFAVSLFFAGMSTKLNGVARASARRCSSLAAWCSSAPRRGSRPSRSGCRCSGASAGTGPTMWLEAPWSMIMRLSRRVR